MTIFLNNIHVYRPNSTERRKRRTLQMFYYIQNNNAPNYLCDLIPPTIKSTNPNTAKVEV